MAEAERWSLPRRASTRALAAMIERVHASLDPLVERAHEEQWYEAILDDIVAIVRRNVDRLRPGR